MTTELWEYVDQPETFGLTHDDVNILKNLPVTHHYTNSTRVEVAAFDWNSPPSGGLTNQTWATSVAKTNVQVGQLLYFRIPTPNIDDAAITRGRMAEWNRGLDDDNWIVATDVSDATWTYYEPRHVFPITRGNDYTWAWQEYTFGIAIDTAHLDSDVVARLIAAGGSDGQVYTKDTATDYASGWENPPDADPVARAGLDELTARIDAVETSIETADWNTVFNVHSGNRVSGFIQSPVEAGTTYNVGADWIVATTVDGNPDHIVLELSSYLTPQRFRLAGLDGINGAVQWTRPSATEQWVRVSSVTDISGGENGRDYWVIADSDGDPATVDWDSNTPVVRLQRNDGEFTYALAPDSVGLPQLDTTGTPGDDVYLRGDMTWATPAGGGGGDSTNAALTFETIDSGTVTPGDYTWGAITGLTIPTDPEPAGTLWVAHIPAFTDELIFFQASEIQGAPAVAPGGNIGGTVTAAAVEGAAATTGAVFDRGHRVILARQTGATGGVVLISSATGLTYAVTLSRVVADVGLIPPARLDAGNDTKKGAFRTRIKARVEPETLSITHGFGINVDGSNPHDTSTITVPVGEFFVVRMDTTRRRDYRFITVPSGRQVVSIIGEEGEHLDLWALQSDGVTRSFGPLSNAARRAETFVVWVA